ANTDILPNADPAGAGGEYRRGLRVQSADAHAGLYGHTNRERPIWNGSLPILLVGHLRYQWHCDHGDVYRHDSIRRYWNGDRDRRGRTAFDGQSHRHRREYGAHTDV